MKTLINVIPNLITLTRFFLAVSFASQLRSLLTSSDFNRFIIPVLLLFMAICMTDFFDGIIARKFNAVSTFGAVMDVTADLFFIVLSYIVLNKYSVIPVWFTALTITKFVEFIVTSQIMKNKCPIKSTFVFDYSGRVSAFLFYIIPCFACIIWGYNYVYKSLVLYILLFLTTFITLISSAIRCSNCFRLLKNTGILIKS